MAVWVLCLNLLIEQEVNVVVFSPESKGTFLFSVYYQWSTLWSYSFSTNQYRQGEQHGTWKKTQSEQQLKEPAGVTLVPAGGTWIWSLMYSSEVRGPFLTFDPRTHVSHPGFHLQRSGTSCSLHQWMEFSCQISFSRGWKLWNKSRWWTSKALKCD